MNLFKVCKLVGVVSVLAAIGMGNVNADCPCDQEDTPRYSSNETGEYGSDQDGFRDGTDGKE